MPLPASSARAAACRIVARPADGQADLAVGEVGDVLRGMEIAQRGPHGFQKLRGALEIGLVGRERVKAEVAQRRRQDLGVIVEERDAAIGEFRRDLGVEDDAPAVDDVIRAHPVGHCRGVVADAGGAPHVDDGVLVARIEGSSQLHQMRVHVDQVGQQVAVQRLIDTGRDLPLQIVAGRHHHVKARRPGQHPRLERVVRIIDVVVDLDAGRLGELRQAFLGDVVRPVVDVHDLLGIGQTAARGDGQQRARCHQFAHLFSLSVGPR